MVVKSLAEALEQEHHEIDGGIEAFLADSGANGTRVAQLQRVITALRRHIYLEEEFVFPPLKASGAFAAVLVMLREHGEIWRTLDSLEDKLVAADGIEATGQLGRELLAQLAAHNEKEEPIIYSQMDAAIPDDAAADLRAFLATGKMPAGWVCARAGHTGN